MCGATRTSSSTSSAAKAVVNEGGVKPMKDAMKKPPSMLARYTCASVVVAVFAVFFNLVFVSDESQAPCVGNVEMHSYKIPLFLTVAYLVSLPLLKKFTDKFLFNVDAKLLLRESMILYNGGQVLLNAWMVYRFIDALLFRDHPFVGGLDRVATGATYTVWVHYCDKYLEFFDTYFMILRGRMDQVSFLHVYHHTSIAWAWYAAMVFWPGGDNYFGALFNSAIHVLMYSYYTLSLLKISCPWKRYLTQAQLAQFTSVIIYTAVSIYKLHGEVQWNHVAAWVIQFFEMASMFILFMHFYNKAYKKKKQAAAATQAQMAAKRATSSDSLAEQASVSSASTDEAEG